MTKYILNTLTILLLSLNLSAQDIDFEKLSIIPKDTSEIPLDYKILCPRLEYPKWDSDYEKYYKYLTTTIRKTQAAISFIKNGVKTTMTPNSIMPHAQLDTTTILKDSKDIIGTWRMLKFRSIRFNDSMDIPTNKYYRLPPVLLEDKSKDEAFAVFSEKHFKLYAKEVGKNEFKKMPSGKYTIENNRFILMYKLSRTAGGVSQIGIDDKGYLIINYPRVIENVKQGQYFSYYAIIEQYIFEKVK